MAKNDAALPGVVEQVVQGLTRPTSHSTHGPAAERRRGEGLTAAALIAPATIFVAFCLLAPLAILFRYSLNEFVPAKKMMVEAVTVANYVKFFTDPYYTVDPGDDGARRRDGDRRSAWCWAFRWPTSWRARRAASSTC